ncbi:MAG TPA: nickel pincer cofactor biosynthesis protein LarC [Blastocatellia bacterium]|nr:nickel pincer cofactor biosynthesis protein LarC [Blastocatellia bacterium]
MRAIYFDCFAGVSGDMIIGALLDLGLDLKLLCEQLSTLGLSGYRIKSERVKRSGIAAMKFDVVVDERKQPARTLSDVREIIGGSGLSEGVKSRALTVFERLAVAEAHVHATTPDRVHFHEVGAVDSIIDTAGAMIGFEALGIDRFYASALRLGRGAVQTEHGLLPIPAPATAELLRGIPVYAGDLEGEFVTPTGAAIVSTLCEGFGPLPAIEIAGAGYGAGSRDPNGFPNALRLLLGEVRAARNPAREDRPLVEDERVFVVETNIDDMSPQVFGFVMDRALALGALDVFMVPAQMKKSRPGVLLTVLCGPDRLDSVIEMLLAETTTLGVRYREASRRVLERAIETVETRYGCVRIKVARDGGRTLHFQPEYDDCARLAGQSNEPLFEVQAAAGEAYRDMMKKRGEAKETNGES